jgi:peptidoglycan/xylan/chitin deacetylase (PgdA/CDA1 family)
MTLAVRWGLLFSILSALVVLSAGPQARANPAAEAAVCAPGTMGVARVVEVDTTGGPKFGAPGPEPFQLLEDKEVVLTFDDGPMRRFTRPILEALDEECVKATFYIVGRMALSDPDTLRDTAQRGHTIALHSWSHKRLDRIGAAASKQEIELGLSATALALGQPVAPFFRFPYLGESSAMRAHLKSRNIANVAIDVDSRDFLTRNPSVMRRNVMNQLAKKGRGIILFHDIQPSTAGGIRALLGELKAKGYKIVHMVPKGRIETLPEFDAMAEREAARRKLALTKQPLADRSAVWPMTPGEGEQLPWTVEPSPSPSPSPSAPPPPANRIVRPVSQPQTTATPDLRPSVTDDSWATNPLGRP